MSFEASFWRGVMTHKVGVWIDHKRAVIASVSAEAGTTHTVESGLEAHPHFSGQQDGGGEKKYEEVRKQSLDRYYDEVITHLGGADALLILGPGEAKVELKARIGRSTVRPRVEVDLETAAPLTDAQFLARVKQHFHLD